MDGAQALSGPGLATADDCDDAEEVSRVGLRYPQHQMSGTITLAHTLTPSHTVRCLDRSTVGDCIGRAVLSGRLRYPKHLGVHAGVGVCARHSEIGDLLRSVACACLFSRGEELKSLQPF